jgi:hypothetical protein
MNHLAILERAQDKEDVQEPAAESQPPRRRPPVVLID